MYEQFNTTIKSSSVLYKKWTFYLFNKNNNGNSMYSACVTCISFISAQYDVSQYTMSYSSKKGMSAL